MPSTLSPPYSKMLDRQYGLEDDYVFVIPGGLAYVVLWVSAYAHGLPSTVESYITDNVTGIRWAWYRTSFTQNIRTFGTPSRHTVSNRLSAFEGWTYHPQPGTKWDFYVSGYSLHDQD